MQVLASTKRLKADDWQFKTYKNKVIEFRSKGRYKYKYAVGRFASREAAQRALAEVRKTFGDAYVVRFDGSSVD